MCNSNITKIDYMWNSLDLYMQLRNAREMEDIKKN